MWPTQVPEKPSSSVAYRNARGAERPLTAVKLKGQYAGGIRNGLYAGPIGVSKRDRLCPGSGNWLVQVVDEAGCQRPGFCGKELLQEALCRRERSLAC